MATVLLDRARQPRVIHDPDDALECVEDICGDDIARYLRDHIAKLEAEDREIAARLNSDLTAYESQLESDRQVFQDIQEKLVCLSSDLNGRRTNREGLRKRISVISKLVNDRI